jgi:competence protein ComEC
MQKPIISLTLAYTVGLLLGRGFLYLPYSVSFLAVVVVFILVVLTWFEKITLRRLFLIVVPSLIGMAAYLYSAAWLPANHYTRVFPDDKATHVMTGTIISPLDRDPDRTAFVLDLVDLDGTPVSGKVRVSVREAVTIIGYGDFIRVSGKMFGPAGYDNPSSFDYGAYLAQSGIYRIVGVKNSGSITVLHAGRGLFRTIQDWRERIRQAFLASTSGPGSAIIQAMVLGEEGGLTDGLRDRFMAAGVTHIISISGSHLGMVALLCFGLVRLLMRLMPERHYHLLTVYADPKKIAALITLPLVLFYTLLAGGQVATVRSLIMITAGLAALLLDRENALMHSLATAALAILLTGPQSLFDISFQLSFISVLSIGYTVLLWNELGLKASHAAQKFRNSAALLILVSLSTSLATGPLVAHYFNQFSLAGVVSNMIVVPFAGLVVVPLGLSSGVLSLFTHHLPFAALNQFAADAFIGIVTFFSRLPIAEFHPPSPGVIWLLTYGAFVLSLAGVARSRLLYHAKPLEFSSRVSRAAVTTAAFAGTLLLIITTLHFFPRRGVEVSFPDVGQGDCSLVRLRSGKTVLIDGGGAYDNRFDIGRRVLAPYLWNKGVRRLDLVILSHPHPDHMNGLKFILKKFQVGQVWESGLDSDLSGYEEFRDIITEKNIPRKTVFAGDAPAVLGEATFTVLHPSQGFVARERQAYAAENDRSLVVRIAFDDRVCLFTGDIHREAEQYLLKSGQDLKCDLLKVPHHGSKTSSSDDFVSTAQPKVAVITCGRGNRFGHPASDVVARYENAGARVYRTDVDGAVTVRFESDGLQTLKWNDLALRRTGLDKVVSPWQQERENLRRMLLRKWEL